MKFRIKTEVKIPMVGKFIHEHVQDFSEDSNVFGRAAEYRAYINKLFPNCKTYCLIDAKEVK